MKRKILNMIIVIIVMVTSVSTFSFANESYIEDNNEFMEDEFHIEGTPNLTRWSYTNSCLLYTSRCV